MSKQKRVLIIIQNLYIPLDRRVWLECQTLRDAGYQVSVICPKGPNDPDYENLDGIHTYKYPQPPDAHGFFGFLYEFAYCWLQTARLSIKVARRHGFDVIQACNPPDTFFALARIYKLFGKKFIFDQHDLCPEVYMSRFEKDSGALLSALRLLEKGTYKTADHVISTNESYKSKALTRGKKRPDDVTIVRTGPDPERLQRVAPNPDLKKGRKYLACYLGVMGPQDGVDYALRAFDVYVHKFGIENCHLALVGKGEALEDLKKLAFELELGDYVTFTGRISDEELFAYLSTADIGLSPDPKNPLNDVSTMNKTMEYMAFGLPVVAFDLIETKVSAGDAAVYATPNDVEEFALKIEDLLSDEALQSTMGSLGRERVVNALGWEHSAPHLLHAYDAALSK